MQDVMLDEDKDVSSEKFLTPLWITKFRLGEKRFNRTYTRKHRVSIITLNKCLNVHEKE